MLLGRWLPIEQHAFDIHAQLGHFFKTLGRDVVLPVTFRLVFFDPLQFLGSFNKDTADSERINRSETVLFITLGSHSAPLVDDGKIPGLFRFRLKDSLAPIKQQVPGGAQGNAHPYATELKNAWQDFIISCKAGMRAEFNCPKSLPHFSTRGNFPGSLHLPLAYQEHLIVHIDAGADVIGNHRDHLAHLEPVRGVGGIKVAVFFVQFD